MRAGTGLLRSGVTRRVLALFLLTALVPIAVAAWLSNAAVGELSAQVDRRLLDRATRQMGLQVFDRLIVAKGLLQHWPNEPALDRLPGQGRIFRSVAWLDADGAVRWSVGDGAQVAAWWRRSHPALDTPPPVPGPLEGQTQPVTLAVLAPPGAAAQVVLAVGPAGAPQWLAVIEPAYLWGPMADADDAGWFVQDVDGHALVDLPLPADPSTAGETLQTARWTLFLAAEFGARDWIFTQRRAASRARWQGWPLERWLALVATATVLVVASLSLSQIRRTLQPLHRLTAGTRRLALGESGVRVPADSRDEFGDLARAFNHMAGRIERQWRSLRGQAEIDRGILQGADIAAIAQHVLATLRGLEPGTCAALMWLDHVDCEALEGFFQSSTGRAPLRLPAQRLTLAQRQALFQWEGDRAWRRAALQGEAGEAPWLAPVCRPGVVWVRGLPVTWAGRTQAMLVLGLRREVPDAALQPAVDLRDRLAVAFTARDRDRALVHRALHDSLTGLANRHGLYERLDTLFDGGRPLALLFIDLDRFKQVNDGHGHAAGDELLRQAAQRLAQLAPAGALVARPGGDEFVVVWPEADEAGAVSLGEAVCAHLAQPFRLRGTEHFLGASVGIALAPAHGDSREALMRAADLAMYAAKGDGRGRGVLFTPALDAQLRERLQLQGELRLALTRDELRLHYQPRIDARDGTIRSAEALVRWQHPQRGLLFPSAFVPLAEESELIESLGRWVLNTACAQMARWQSDGLGLRRVSVNVSPRQLASGRLVQEVREVLERHRLAPEALELEVTESLLVGDTSEAHAQLAELRRWGLTVALDDFGTGYSSLSTLRALPIDVMKVDRAFVKDLGRDDSALAVTRAILALAGAMRLHTVAEGIETAAQAATLQALGCDELQGFLYARPLPAEAFVRLPAWGAQREAQAAA